MLSAKFLPTLMMIASLPLLGVQAQACSCTRYPMRALPVMLEVLHEAVDLPADYELDYKDVKEVKAYPSFLEKMNFYQFKGTSCEGHHHDAASTYVCAPSYKSDYVIQVPSKNCAVTVQVKASYTKATAKTLDSTCE